MNLFLKRKILLPPERTRILHAPLCGVPDLPRTATGGSRGEPARQGLTAGICRTLFPIICKTPACHGWSACDTMEFITHMREKIGARGDGVGDGRRMIGGGGVLGYLFLDRFPHKNHILG